MQHLRHRKLVRRRRQLHVDVAALVVLPHVARHGANAAARREAPGGGQRRGRRLQLGGAQLVLDPSPRAGRLHERAPRLLAPRAAKDGRELVRDWVARVDDVEEGAHLQRARQVRRLGGQLLVRSGGGFGVRLPPRQQEARGGAAEREEALDLEGEARVGDAVEGGAGVGDEVEQDDRSEAVAEQADAAAPPRPIGQVCRVRFVELAHDAVHDGLAVRARRRVQQVHDKVVGERPQLCLPLRGALLE